MVSEILIGRRSGTSPINSMKKAAIESNRSSSWQLVGWTGIIAGVLILSFYSVIAGLCLNYIFLSAASSGAVDAQTQFGTVTVLGGTIVMAFNIYDTYTFGCIGWY